MQGSKIEIWIKTLVGEICICTFIKSQILIISNVNYLIYIKIKSIYIYVFFIIYSNYQNIYQ